MKHNIFIQHIEAIAPLKGACSWDSSGIQVQSTRQYIHRCLVALDLTIDVLTYAISIDADIIITHHPLSLTPLSLARESFYTELLRLLYQHNITLYSAHTSLDSTTHSISGFLASLLSLDDIRPIECIYSDVSYIFTIYTDDSISLIQDISTSNIVYIESHTYDSICTIIVMEKDIKSMKVLLHQQGYHYSYAMLDNTHTHYGIGCIGVCKEPISRSSLFTILKEHCGITHMKAHGTIPDYIRHIAYCAGAGSSLISTLTKDKQDIDVYITGEIKHHDVIYSTFPLLDVGHFHLEESMMHIFSKELQTQCPDIAIEMYSSIPPFAHMIL